MLLKVKNCDHPESNRQAVAVAASAEGTINDVLVYVVCLSCGAMADATAIQVVA